MKMAGDNRIIATDEDKQRVDGLYRALIRLRIHHDRMLWSRVQLLIAVQGVVIGGSYAVGDHTLAGVFLVAGAVLSLVVYELVTKDQLNRDANDAIIEALGALLIPKRVADQLVGEGRTRPFIRMSADAPRWRPFVRGRYLIRIVIWAFIVFDIALAMLHLVGMAPILETTS